MGLKCLGFGAILSGVLLSGTYGTLLKEAVVASGNDFYF